MAPTRCVASSARVIMESMPKESGYKEGEMSKLTLHCRLCLSSLRVFGLLVSRFANDNDNKMLMAQIIVKQERKTETELELELEKAAAEDRQ